MMNRLPRGIRSIISGAMIFGLLCSIPMAQANEETLYNVFSLTSEATAEVDNDLMVATLVVQAEDKDSAMLASKINASMSWAVNTLRPFGTLETKTRDYQTYPVYDAKKNRKLIGWRGSQTIQIETDDFEAAGKAIQKLQERLQVQGIQLSAKPKTRSAAADLLITQALSAFKARAALVQRNMGSTGFRILDVNIQSQQGGGMHRSRSSNMEMMSSSAKVSAPAIEAGTSRVSVQVFGRVQLD